MKKVFVVLISLIAVTSMFIGSVSANSKDVVNANETSNSIVLNWDMEGESFKVYRNQELVWEGNDKSFEDINLEPDYLYSYRIGAYNSSNELIAISNLKTKTKKLEKLETKLYSGSVLNVEEKNTQEENIKTDLTSNVGSDYVRLTWGTLEDYDGIYEIYRDGEFIGETTKNSYLDKTVGAGKTYKYSIESAAEVSQGKKDYINDYIEKNNIELSNSEKEDMYLKPHTLIRVVETNDAVSTEKELKSKDLPEKFVKSVEESKKRQLASASSLKYTILFRYQTFIPDYRVSPPLVSTEYAGDNRSFDFWSNEYRTRSDIFAGWALGQELYQNRDVGTTTQYKDGEVNKKTASESGIRLTKDLVSSSKMMWRLNHDVGDPFCKCFPNITIYYEGILYSNYSFEVRGSHDKAPNHEFYFALAYTEDTPGEIFKYEGGSLFNLFPGMPQRYFEFSI